MDQQPTKDIEASIAHDQLPSMEEAKLNAGVYSSRNPFKQAILIATAVAGVILILFVVTFTLTSKGEGSSALHFESNLRKEIVKVLESVSEHKQLISRGTAQNRAASWIMNDPVGEYFLTNGRHDELKQRYILTVFYYSMGGERWEDDLGFLSTEDVCSWFRTRPNRRLGMSSMFVGAWCNDVGKIVDLKFPEGYLSDTIPSELQYLTDLEVVDFGNNPSVKGEFPSFVQKLSNLSYLGLQYCSLQGKLPEWIGSMTLLKTLVLSNNQFTGAIPNSIGFLSDLEYLYLDDNTLHGAFETFGSLTNLKHLIIEDNQFTGALTDSTVQKLSNLQTLDISNNQIESTIPSTIWRNFIQLKVLDIHGNEFNGALPPVDRVYSQQLEFLAVNDNNLEEEIPSTLAKLNSLKHLDLSNNAFDATLPDSFESLSNLRYFFVAHNPLKEGKIPTFLRAMPSLVDLSLQNTNRVGTVPDWMGPTFSLTLLDLGHNSLQGPIPDSIAEMTSLKHLLLNRNNLEGSISPKLSGLTTLLLDHNGFLDSAEAVCSFSASTLDAFTADCSGFQPLVSCPCCTLCCESGDASCNSHPWNGSVDGIWEYFYRRGSGEYEFSKEP